MDKQLKEFIEWWYVQVGCEHVPGDHMIDIIEFYEHDNTYAEVVRNIYPGISTPKLRDMGFL